MAWLWAVVTLFLGACHSEMLTDDSLRGALEAIYRRQRDFADPTLYYTDQFHPPREGSVLVSYPQHGDGDGQPEDIGYGYQKSLSPKTAGVFESIPLPDSELGSHDPGVESYTPEGKSLENIILDYIEDNMENSKGIESHRHQFRNQKTDIKKSVFRERDINNLPDALQNLHDQEDTERKFENGEHIQVVPSSFRERFSSKPVRNFHVQNAQNLVRNFGGLDRDTESMPGSDDDPDEYLSMLNSIWEKYQDSSSDNSDPEDLSGSDVEEILDYISHKEKKKHQYGGNYDVGNDFLNSPLAWVKRGRQSLTDINKPPSDQFLHALKFLNGHTGTLELMQEEDVPDEERDADVAKLLLEEQMSRNNKKYKKRFWRGNTYEDHHKNIVKRYPIAKRSSSYYTSPAVLYHKASHEEFNQRKKKNVKNHMSDETTDPKVARELSDIFSSSDNVSDTKQNKTDNTQIDSFPIPSDSENSTHSETLFVTKQNSTKLHVGEISQNHLPTHHMHRKRSGQKEELNLELQNTPMVISKKNSIDWSDYFGIDKRRKKSVNKPENDEWLLDQYLKAYSISARAIKDPDVSQHESLHFEKRTSHPDDMDSKLRAMEDMIVDQALKYTGAHEGITDSEEVQAVKDRVIAQLAAAYSLEKMRKALSEFKSSIAAQKASAPMHTTSITPIDVSEEKDKRVAVKKEKVEIHPDGKLERKEDTGNRIGVLHSTAHFHPSWNKENSCPVMDDITQRCKQIAKMAGDSAEALVPLCNLHQVCYLCGPEMGAVSSGCDVTFLSEANSLCGDSPRCRYTMSRTIAAMHSLRGDPSPLGCDYQNHPCLARYLAITMR